jgi:hypothetical protein
MTAKTFTNTGGGSWETGTNWNPAGVPGTTDDATIDTTVPGIYSVTIGAAEDPDSVTLNDALATLLINSTGALDGGPLTVSAGTVTAAGVLDPSSITLNGTAAAVVINAASAFQGGPLTVNAGTVTANGVLDPSSLTLDGTLAAVQINSASASQVSPVTVTAGTLSVTGVLDPASIVLNGSGAAAALAVGGSAGTVTVGTLTVNEFGTVGVAAGGVLDAGIIFNDGTMSLASEGTIVTTGSLTGSGVITLASFAVADMYNTDNTTVFLDGRGELKLESPSTFTATIAGFQHGDKIDLVATPVTGVPVYTPDPAQPSNGGVLTVMNGTSVQAALNLEGNYIGFTFAYSTDGNGNDVVVGCFAAGTSILTEAGDIPVEDLREGDLLPVRSQPEPVPIASIGRRGVDCLRHPNPASVWPVRVAARAFAPGQPRRDLYLSPDHAVFVDGVLIPIKHLINGTTIQQVPRDEVTYYHVEFERHDVLLAEGLPCESYLDMGDRHRFGNGGDVIALHPDFSSVTRDVAAMWEARGCAPLVVTGPRLDAARRRVDPCDMPARHVA